MKTLKALLVLVMTAGLIFTAAAQPKQKRGKGKLDSIAVKYNFTAAQKTSFKAAVKDKRTKLKALKAKTDLSKEAKKAEAKKIRTDFDNTIKSFLSNDQYTRMKADAKAKRDQHRSKKMEKKINNRADSMKAKYGLSADQHAKVKTAMSSFNAARKTAASSGEKGSDARKTAMKKARQDFDTSMKSILTDAQYKQWKADMKAKRKNRKAKKK